MQVEPPRPAVPAVGPAAAADESEMTRQEIPGYAPGASACPAARPSDAPPRMRHNAFLLHRLARRSHSWSRVISSSVKYTFQGIPLASWYPVSFPTLSQ